MVGLALKIAQTQHFLERLKKPVVLLLDDPAAELDKKRCQQLFELIDQYPVQIIVTALDPERLPLRSEHKLFHVEQGSVAETPSAL
ncbi:MAG: hypothetical protein HKM24_01080 [Gammaproteobacteria bacterium]|nr:hypothetical protein [Gammaproteobacteria bacterium]